MLYCVAGLNPVIWRSADVVADPVSFRSKEAKSLTAVIENLSKLELEGVEIDEPLRVIVSFVDSTAPDDATIGISGSKKFQNLWSLQSFWQKLADQLESNF